MSETIDLFTIPETDKARLNILFLAEHAAAGGALHGEDGNHAVYHHEVLTTLREIGDINVTPQSDFSALYDKTDFDFVFTLLNAAQASR